MSQDQEGTCPVPTAQASSALREGAQLASLPNGWGLESKADTYPPTHERRRVQTHWGRFPPAQVVTGSQSMAFQDRRERKGPLAVTTSPMPHTQIPRDHPLNSQSISPASSAEETSFSLLPGAMAFTSPLPSKTANHQPLGEAAQGQTYSELVQQQSEHLQGRHGAVDSHVGHGPIGRSEHGGLHRKGEAVQGEARGDTGLTPGRVWASCQPAGTEQPGTAGEPGLCDHLCLFIHTDPHTSCAQIQA